MTEVYIAVKILVEYNPEDVHPRQLIPIIRDYIESIDLTEHDHEAEILRAHVNVETD